MTNDNYYNIKISYEIPYNVLDSNDPDIVQARNILYDKLKDSVPEDKYEKFSVKLFLHQLRDTYNYVVTYDAFFRSTSGRPMEEYVGARDIKDAIKKELEEFFNSVDCEYKQLNIKPLL